MRGGLGAIVLGTTAIAISALSPSISYAQHHDSCKFVFSPSEASKDASLEHKALVLINSFRNKNYFGEVIRAEKNELGEETYELKYETKHDGKSLSMGIEIGFDEDGFMYVNSIFNDAVIQFFGIREEHKGMLRVGKGGKWVPNTCYVLSTAGPDALDIYAGKYFDGSADKRPIASYSKHLSDNLPGLGHVSNEAYRLFSGVVETFIEGISNLDVKSSLDYSNENYGYLKEIINTPFPVSMNAPAASTEIQNASK